MGQCRKIRYRDKLAAKLALAMMPDQYANKQPRRRPKDERRAYRCPACKGWHLTSQDR